MHPPAQPGQKAVHSRAELCKKAVHAAGNRGALTTTVMALRQGLVVQARCCRVSAIGDKSWDVLTGFV